MSLKNDAASVLGDPEWLPSRWDRQANTLQFVHLSRADHDGVTFLGEEYLAKLQPPSLTLDLAEIAAAKPPAAPSPHYIFHSAFCCSTLLARALDLPGTSMALKEPQILNTVTEAARAKALSREVLQLFAGLLARPFGAGERVIIKPSNVVNLLATGLLEIDAGSKAIFLYAPLRRFLRSVADKGLFGRVWARTVFKTLRVDTGLNFGYSSEDLLDLTDLQVAALAWLMHHAQAAALIERLPGRVRTLDSETFLARRSDTLGRRGRPLRARSQSGAGAGSRCRSRVRDPFQAARAKLRSRAAAATQGARSDPRRRDRDGRHMAGRNGVTQRYSRRIASELDASQLTTQAGAKKLNPNLR